MKVQKTVYFVRHAQSLGNAEAVFQPPDSPLSEIGRGQAVRIAERISKLPIQALISSTFLRAKQTAEVISKAAGLEPYYCDLFVERIKPTSINGKPYEDGEANAIWKDWNESLYTSGMRVADGENFDDLVARAGRALAYLEGREEDTLAMVTHGYFLRTAVARAILGDLLCGEVFRRFQRIGGLENTGLTVMRYQGAPGEQVGWRLLTYNDHAHLG
jgi:broad specificity phosphatase PhoE